MKPEPKPKLSDRFIKFFDDFTMWNGSPIVMMFVFIIILLIVSSCMNCSGGSTSYKENGYQYENEYNDSDNNSSKYRCQYENEYGNRTCTSSVDTPGSLCDYHAKKVYEDLEDAWNNME